jgi:hypothetical protein
MCLRRVLSVLEEYMSKVQQYHHQANAQQSEYEKLKKKLNAKFI